VKKLARIAGLLGASLWVAGCGAFGDKDDELEPMELSAINETVNIRRVWNADLGGDAEYQRVALRPAGDGNRLYAAGSGGNVSAFEPESGKRLWQANLDTPLTAGPGVGEGVVVVVSREGHVIALEASDGSERWRAKLEAESLARPLIKDETVIVQTIDNRLEAFSIFDGRARWSLQRSAPSLTVRGSSSPVAVGTVAIAGFDSGRLVAVDIDTGTEVWDTLLSPPQGRSDLDRLSDIDGELAVVGQDLYASGYNGRLAAIASESGQILWSREISSLEGVAADWNNLYTVRDDGEIVALDRRNGAEAWRDDSLLRRELTLAIPFGSTVVVGDLEGYMHFFSTLDGQPVARKQLGNKAISSDPYVIANRLYVQSDSGVLGAYVIVDERPRRSQPDIADES
jgi:outer membrane protein assembly factor BamB